jgi:hypothetical protein
MTISSHTPIYSSTALPTGFFGAISVLAKEVSNPKLSTTHHYGSRPQADYLSIFILIDRQSYQVHSYHLGFHWLLRSYVPNRNIGRGNNINKQGKEN